jgi:hypothetical protein
LSLDDLPSILTRTEATEIGNPGGSGIFISYRRDDAAGEAGRLSDDLQRALGENAVFLDVVGIKLGRDFRKVIHENVGGCAVLLAVIGPQWATITAPDGTPRLQQANDYVRLEIATALQRDIPVIPVLVRGAHLPNPDQLPADLAEMVYRNSVELSHPRWHSDVALLVAALKELIREFQDQQTDATARNVNRQEQADALAGEEAHRSQAAMKEQQEEADRQRELEEFRIQKDKERAALEEAERAGREAEQLRSKEIAERQAQEQNNREAVRAQSRTLQHEAVTDRTEEAETPLPAFLASATSANDDDLPHTIMGRLAKLVADDQPPIFPFVVLLVAALAPQIYYSRLQYWGYPPFVYFITRTMSIAGAGLLLFASRRPRWQAIVATVPVGLGIWLGSHSGHYFWFAACNVLWAGTVSLIGIIVLRKVTILRLALCLVALPMTAIAFFWIGSHSRSDFFGEIPVALLPVELLFDLALAFLFGGISFGIPVLAARQLDRMQTGNSEPL